MIDSIDAIEKYLPVAIKDVDLNSGVKNLRFRDRNERMNGSHFVQMCSFPLPQEFHQMDHSRKIAIEKWYEWATIKRIFWKGHFRHVAIGFVSGSGNGKSHLIDFIQKQYAKDEKIEIVAITANDSMGANDIDRRSFDKESKDCVSEKYLPSIAARMLFSYFVDVSDKLTSSEVKSIFRSFWVALLRIGRIEYDKVIYSIRREINCKGKNMILMIDELGRGFGKRVEVNVLKLLLNRGIRVSPTTTLDCSDDVSTFSGHALIFHNIDPLDLVSTTKTSQKEKHQQNKEKAKQPKQNTY